MYSTSVHPNIANFPADKSTQPSRRSPLLLIVVFVSTGLSMIPGEAIPGVPLSGVAWVVPLAWALVAAVNTPGKTAFPVGIWLPWLGLVVLYTAVSDSPSAIQRSVMIFCPLVIGAVVSRARIFSGDLDEVRRHFSKLQIAIVIVALLRTAILVTGVLPVTSDLAALVMTSTLLCATLATRYATGERLALLWWAVLTAIPIVGVTRTGIAAAALTLPLTLAPISPKRRLLLLTVVSLAGLAVFQTEPIQRKMFYSGSGTLSEVRADNLNFATTGRTSMWTEMSEAIARRPLLGHGANASEALIADLTNGALTHPHNDWLRLLYDYGYLGAAVFALTLLAQTLHTLRHARHATGEARILLFSGASSFIPFAMFMSTDNIILYAAFFGNLQFMTLGLGYAALRTQQEDRVNTLRRTAGDARH